MIYQKNKFAFTLAEVLITLGIIGIVASMTIPTLMANQQRQQFATALAHFVSDFNNGLGLMKTDAGCVDLACTGIWNSAGNDTLWSNLKATGRLKLIKDCGIAAGGGCFASTTKDLNGNTKATSLDDNTTIAKGILTNGMSIAVWGAGTNCVETGWGSGALSEMCGPMYVDVNGLKPPNTVGRDIFSLRITNRGGASPFGIMTYSTAGHHWNDNSSGYACDPTNYPTGNGLTCAGRIQEKGWVMDY